MDRGEGHLSHPENQAEVPRLLSVSMVSENLQFPDEPTVVYCPPIMGTAINGDIVQGTHCKALYMFDQILYGYPDFAQYVKQATDILPDVSPNLILVGFSAGARLAACLGQELLLPPNQVLLLAPIIESNTLLSRRYVAWRENRSSEQQTEAVSMSRDQNYLGRLLSSRHQIYHQSGAIPSRWEQIKALDLSRKQWIIKPGELYGTIVSGRRDPVSPPSDLSSIIIEEASHRLEAFVPFLQQRFQ